MEPLKKTEPAPEIEFNLVDDDEPGIDANQGKKLEIVSQYREGEPIVSEEWDKRLREIVNKYRRSTESFHHLRSKLFFPTSSAPIVKLFRLKYLCQNTRVKFLILRLEY